MNKFSLRWKLLLVSVFLALIPLCIAGWHMMGIIQDELKSSANEELSSTAKQISNEIDNFYIHTWGGPLLLVRDAIDNEKLGVEQKVTLLTLGVEEVVDIVALQLALEGSTQPFIVKQEEFNRKLTKAGLKADSTLMLSPQKIAELGIGEALFIGDLTYISQIDAWLITMSIPLEKKIMGRSAKLLARIDLQRLKRDIKTHPFAKTTQITLIEADGRKIFDSKRPDLSAYSMVEIVKVLLKNHTPIAGVHHYQRPNGEKILGAYAFPQYLNWGVLVEKREAQAYLAVAKMSNSLILWAFFGVVVATIAAILIAISLTKPLLRLTKAASIVSSGDFSVKIEGHGRSDEIGTLSTAFIKMVGDLNHYINELTETTKLKERAESELRLGRDIQQNFIPKEFPQLDTIEFWGMCEPARLVGGDFIDYITINEHKYGFVVGDVSGKGVPAALFLSMCRTLFRTICVQIESPEKVLEEFNNKIIELDPSGNMFITLLYCIFDWETGKMYFSTAGHNMPFIRLAKKSREQASFEMLPPIKTMVAGMIEDISFELVEIALSRGDILVLYTDGMTEAMNDKGEMFGEAKLIELLNNKYHLSAKQICEETVMEVKDFQIGMEQFDDMTMFVLKLKEA